MRSLKELDSDLGKIKFSEINSKIFIPRRDWEIADMVAEHLYERPNSRTIVFCKSIDHAERMTDALPGDVASLHSKQSPKLQEQRLKQFKSGELDMLTVVGKLDEGVDIPEADVLVFLRSTESRTVFLQQLGRGLRKTADKEDVLVLDFVASWERIKDVQKLHTNIQHSYQSRPKPKAARTTSPFRFDFSEEVLNAINVIEYARDKLAGQPEPLPSNRELADIEIERLLGAPLPTRTKMPKAQEQQLLKQIAQGDPDAELEYLRGRSRTIYSTIVKFPEMSGLTRADYFQIGCETVLSAAKDSLQNTAAQDYPTTHLHNIIGQAIQYTIKTQRLAPPKAFSKAGNRMQADWQQPESTVPLEEAQGITDPEEPFENVLKSIGDQALRNALENLGFRERRVLELRYGLDDKGPRTLGEAGRTFSISAGRVRQIEIQSLKKLRHLPKNQRILDVIHEVARPRRLALSQEKYSQEQIRISLRVAAKRLNIETRPVYWAIQVSAGQDIAALSLALSPLISRYDDDKHVLFKRTKTRFGEGLSYVDYIRTLHAMEEHGLVRCTYNERGSVIKTVSAARTLLNS